MIQPHHKEKVLQFLYGVRQEDKDRLLHQIRLYRVLGIFKLFAGLYYGIGIEYGFNEYDENITMKPSLLEEMWDIDVELKEDNLTLFSSPQYINNNNRFFWTRPRIPEN